MNKLLVITILGFLMLGCDASEVAEPEAVSEAASEAESEVKAFHPTDDISAQSQGGKGHTSDGSEVKLP
jgi:hypothetical protein|tara:strand:- start:134 stop:340 length:207 start_codon:yes stop_codon:yes gene_type:complete